MRTPLGKARGLGPARNGTAHWWAQRMTSVALVPLVVWFIVSIAALTGADHATIVAWIANPFTAVLLALMVIAGFYHLKLGGQVIIEDYVHHEGLKIAGLMALNFACAAVGLASIFAILKISFGS
ncbi:MAG: succinate dehydrogenase, hydrophobic membrane anchor protein [Proteobacteria bacterium]|nr:succinate dehydrogenase, hydrophobic membrane anchor protein [Pseudomonadota bacterium]